MNKLRVEDKIELEKPLDISEVGRGVSSLKNEKSPGPDGFSAEFFKFFWPDLKFFLLRSFKEGYDKGELSISQKMGIVSILPKGGKPREFLKKLASNFIVKCDIQNFFKLSCIKD